MENFNKEEFSFPDEEKKPAAEDDGGVDVVIQSIKNYFRQSFSIDQVNINHAISISASGRR